MGDTKALLLSTFMKFINMYDDLSDRILAVFKSHHSAFDPEIQQRSIEYTIMAQYDNQELITTVWEAMPDFPERDSALMRILNKKNKKKTYVKSSAADDDDDDEEEEEEEEEAPQKVTKTTPNKAAAPQEQDLLSDLFGSSSISSNGVGNGHQNEIELVQDKAKLIKLLLSPSGVLFENETIQIGFRSQVEMPGGVMKILLYFGNKSASNISVQSVACSNRASLGNFEINFNPKTFDISPKQQREQQCKVALNSPLSLLPKVKISFTSGSNSYTLNCDFPVIATKFFKPHVFEPQQFKQRWQQLKNEKQQIIQIKKDYDANKLRGILSNGMGMGLISGVDQNPNNAIGCSVYHFAKKRDDNNFVTMPVLLRLEFNPQNSAIRITVRSPHLATTSSVLAAFIAVFKP